ncbi:MAG: monovalent cation/H+ antiporter complex subunit F [Candidatus Sulfotelmatobacter sp.]
MNIWELSAQVMMFALAPLLWTAMRGDARHRLVSFYMVGTVITLLMMLLTIAFDRMPMMDLAIAMALMSFGGGIVFAHFFARLLR